MPKSEWGMRNVESETGLSLKLIPGQQADSGFISRETCGLRYHHPGRRAD
jgi:hypothetical protein